MRSCSSSEIPGRAAPCAPSRRPSSGPSSSPGRSCPSPSLLLLRAFGAFLSVTVVRAFAALLRITAGLLRRTVPRLLPGVRVVVPLLLLLLLLFEQALGVGVVVLRLSIRRIQTQRLLVAFERLAVFLLAELRIAQIEERLGPLVIAAQRVGRRSPHGLLGAVVAPGPVEGVAQVVARLEALRRRFERPLILPDSLLETFVRIVAVAPPHAAPLGHPLCRRLGHSGQAHHYDQ